MKCDLKRILRPWLGAALFIFAAAEATAAVPGVYLNVKVCVAESGSLDSALSGANHPPRCDSVLYIDPRAALTDELGVSTTVQYPWASSNTSESMP